MAILEVGFILNGIPIISKQYYKEQGKTVDRTLRSGFMAAIIDFAKEAFSDDLETFNLRNVRIFLISKNVESEDEMKNLIGYIIGDKKLDAKIAKKSLDNCSKKFMSMYPNLRSDIDLNSFKPFLKIFDKILGDLAKKPYDRMQSIFGAPKK